MLAAVRRVIDIAIAGGHLRSDYALLGHRQTRPTECPGDRLFAEIRTWSHFEPLPTVVEAPTATTLSTTTDTTMTTTVAE